MLFVTIRFPQKGDPRRHLGCKLKVCFKENCCYRLFCCGITGSGFEPESASSLKLKFAVSG